MSCDHRYQYDADRLPDIRRAFGTLGIRQLACTEQAVLEHEHWSVKVAALQTAHKNALTCTAIAEGGCFGTALVTEAAPTARYARALRRRRSGRSEQ
jgi:hypothetical protein